MTAPLRTQAVLRAAPTGEVFYRHVYFREGQEQNAVAATDTEYRRTLLFGETSEQRREAAHALLAARVSDAMTTARSRELAVARQNAVTNDVNARISELLTKVTSEKGRASAEDWWAWWEDHEELVSTGTKPVYAYYGYRQGFRYQDPYRYLPPSPPPPPPPPHKSCFVAGTPVWTEDGPKPIEQIRVGDRMLAQDVESGELTFKPVLRTTERAQAETFAVTIDGHTLRCTGGHLFWVAGRGWLKARLLEPGQSVHAVEGAANVTQIAPSGKETTHNLVVADHHNYFVGPNKLLTHDVTPREPTAAVLPGLVRE
jgi:hypothetical protein